MTHEYRGIVLDQVQQIFDRGAVSGLSEEQLLERFVARRDEIAFEALIVRHGPMVWGVCRRVLGNAQAVEDAFQATFLVLLKRAGSLRDPRRLGPWLHGVAYRVAIRARREAAGRVVRERNAAKAEAVDPAGPGDADDLRAVLDDELSRLPERYRHPVILCHLEGMSYQEAARRLRWTEGMVRGRLARARERLRGRLVRRGLAPATALALISTAVESPAAAVPVSLVAATIVVAKIVILGEAASTTMVAASVITLADGALSMMLLSKLKFVAAAAAVLFAALPFALAFDEPRASRSAAVEPKPTRTRSAETDAGPKAERLASPLDLQVIDQRTDEPLKEVAVAVSINGKTKIEARTDQAGRYTVSLPLKASDAVTIKARAEGFVPMAVDWNRPGAGAVAATLPRNLRLSMESGTTIGSVVRDADGRPIAGAAVFLTVPAVADQGQPHIDIREESVRTDADGRWHYNAFPANQEEVWIRLQHPDYLSETRYGAAPRPTIAELRDQTGLLVMDKGLAVTGLVLDQRGQPLAGAVVSKNDDRLRVDVPETRTDAKGRFRFDHVAPGDLVLTVQAAGHAPDLRRVKVNPTLPPVEFRLDAGRVIRGRTVDPEGKPVAGAWVVVDQWRGDRFLHLETRSKADGTFQLHDAPPDVVRLQVAHAEFMNAVCQASAESDRECLITLHQQLTIRGSVVDAESGQPIEAFTLLVVSDPNDEHVSGDPSRLFRFQGGRYEVTLRGMSPRIQGLSVKAEGYLPAISRGVSSVMSSQVFDFKLTRTKRPTRPAVSGVVRRANGSPAPEAEVYLATKSRPVIAQNGKLLLNAEMLPMVRTGGEGRFSFPPQVEDGVVFVLDKQGYAIQTEEELKTQPLVTLVPWGRVEGTVRVGNQPGASEKVILRQSSRDQWLNGRIVFNGSAVADASGRFVLDRVLAEPLMISREVPFTPHKIGFTPWIPVKVEPGQTVHLTIGGLGRPVTGRFVKPAGLKALVDFGMGHARLRLNKPVVPMPVGLTAEQKAEWYERWLMTDAGREYLEYQGLDHNYPVRLEADGSFRIEEVEPGTYELFVRVDGLSDEGRHPVAGASRMVTIPAMPGGRSDVPLELGEVELLDWERFEQEG